MSNGESRQDGFEERREGFGSSAPRQPQLRLPFFKPWVPRPAAGAADAPPSPPVALESCGVKLIMGTIGGELCKTHLSTQRRVISVECVKSAEASHGWWCTPSGMQYQASAPAPAELPCQLLSLVGRVCDACSDSLKTHTLVQQLPYLHALNDLNVATQSSPPKHYVSMGHARP